jgi:Glu-tRNA(Gln) amidotransferase subunit E-like FAD-binding protein
MTSNDFNLTSNDFNTKIINKYLCQYCNNEFTRKNNLNYHIKNICKEKIKKDKEENIYKQQIEKLTNDLEKLKNKSTNKIITYNTLTNNNLTNINNICKEKISDLTRDEKKYIMSHGMNGCNLLSFQEIYNLS